MQPFRVLNVRPITAQSEYFFKVGGVIIPWKEVVLNKIDFLAREYQEQTDQQNIGYAHSVRYAQNYKHVEHVSHILPQKTAKQH